jgi:hypothetical protein
MKFNYSKRQDETTFRKAGVDTDVVSHWELVEQPQGNILVLYLGLGPVDTYTEIPRYNGKGIINGYDSKKVSDVPKIYVTIQEEIDAFLAQWV